MKIEEKKIIGANILKVRAGTTGYKGGDSGHGGKTLIEIQDESDTDIEITVSANRKGVTIDLGGDSELDTMIEALEFAVETLKDQRDN